MAGPAPILVVGASGFVGRALVRTMAKEGLRGVALSRSPPPASEAVRSAGIDSYSDSDAVAAAAAGCASAILLAGRAHVLAERATDPLRAFMTANRDMPVAVARGFAAAGGRRLVFVSSVAVNGTETRGTPFRESGRPAPTNDYGRSKLEGEQALAAECAALDLELVIVRPPLVYGPGAPGNFGQLLSAARRGIPLPLASIRNRRDFIGIDNLVDILLRAAAHPAAAGETFLVSDGQTVSTSAFVGGLYRAAGHSRRLWPFPPTLLRAAATALGRRDAAERLLGDLELDIAHVRRRLDWEPPVGLDEGLRRSVQ